MLGVFEEELVEITLSFNAKGRFDDVLHGGFRNAFHPAHLRLFCRPIPDLFVVWNKVFLGEPIAESGIAPLSQVGRRVCVLILQIPDQTFVSVLAVKSADAVFKWVFYKVALVENIVEPFAIVDVLAERVLNDSAHLLVFGKEDMAADVIAKAILPDCGAEASYFWSRFQYL